MIAGWLWSIIAPGRKTDAISAADPARSPSAEPFPDHPDLAACTSGRTRAHRRTRFRATLRTHLRFVRYPEVRRASPGQYGAPPRKHFAHSPCRRSAVAQANPADQRTPAHSDRQSSIAWWPFVVSVVAHGMWSRPPRRTCSMPPFLCSIPTLTKYLTGPWLTLGEYSGGA